MNAGQLIVDMMRDQQSLLTALMIFLAAGTLAFTVMAVVRVRDSVKRRTERVMEEGGRSNPKRSLRYASLTAVAQLIEYTTKHYAAANSDNMKVLRKRLIQAGIFDPRAVAVFFIGRTVFAVAIAAALFVLGPMVMSKGGSAFWLVVIAGGIAGYVGPSMYIDKRIKARRFEHRMGFPDFMDLLVVCADSGLSMEASLERVGGDVLLRRVGGLAQEIVGGVAGGERQACGRNQ